MGTATISAIWANSLRYILLLSSPAVSQSRFHQAKLRTGVGARAPHFPTSRLRLCDHARARSLTSQRTARSLLADAIKSLKQGVSRRAIANVASAGAEKGPTQAKRRPEWGTDAAVESADTERPKGPTQAKRRLEWGTVGTVEAFSSQTSSHHFWQKRYHDFNVRNYDQFLEKINYTHQNPVRRGLCKRAEDWPWSSFLQYATGSEGRVQIECEWTARRRERAAGTLCPAVELPHSSQKRA